MCCGKYIKTYNTKRAPLNFICFSNKHSCAQQTKYSTFEWNLLLSSKHLYVPIYTYRMEMRSCFVNCARFAVCVSLSLKSSMKQNNFPTCCKNFHFIMHRIHSKPWSELGKMYTWVSLSIFNLFYYNKIVFQINRKYFLINSK